MPETPDRTGNPFDLLRQVTPARIGLGRAGQGLPTAPLLAFQLAHARARDAVDGALDVERISAAIGGPTLVVDSAALDRTAYLQDPNLGRRLGPDVRLPPRGDHDLAIVIADGLSATAANVHAATVTQALSVRLPGWSIAPVVLVRQGRVAIGDPIGLALGAHAVVVLIGERPGLSAADSLSAYLTWDPKPGRLDSERNCVSNIRSPNGLAPDQAADKIAWLLQAAAHLGFTGVLLKDRLITGEAPENLPKPKPGLSQDLPPLTPC